MAQVNLTVARGNKVKDMATSTGALTLASDNVALSFNQSGTTGLTRGDVLVCLEMFEQYIASHSFPPA